MRGGPERRRAGRLRARVTIETSTRSADGDILWTSLDTVWAEIAPASATEREIAGHAGGVASHRVTLRHRDDVTSACRLRLAGRVLHVIAAFDPDETGVWLSVLAEEEGR